MNKKLTLTILSVFLVVAVLVGTWQSSNAAFISKNSYEIGRGGIFMPNGFSTQNVSLKTASPGGWGAPVKFTRPLLQPRWVDNSGNANDTPFQMTYVFFVLRQAERKLWDKGELKIYYMDTHAGGWKTCPAFLVSSKNEPSGRISCAITRWNTVYGLGTKK